MNDREFDKIFEEKLNKAQDIPFDEKAWENLQQHLDENQGRQRVVPAYWLILALLPFLLLAAWNISTWKAMAKIKQQKASIEIGPSKVIVDTIFKHITVVVFDTIYRQTMHPKEDFHVQTFSNGAYSLVPSFMFKKVAIGAYGFEIGNDSESKVPDIKNLSLQNIKNLMANNNADEQIGEENDTPKINHIDSIAARNPTELLATRMIYLQKDSHVALGLKPIMPVKIRKRSFSFPKMLNAIKPKIYKVGLSGGITFPMSSLIHEEFSYIGGVKFEIHSSDNISLWGGGQYFTSNIESEIMDASIGVPVIQAPNDSYLFQNATTTQPILDYSLGLQYYFRVRHKLNPFIGGGIGSQKIFDHSIQYIFEDPLTQEEFEINKNYEYQNGVSNPLLFIGKVGINWQFSNHFHWQIEGVYRNKLKTITKNTVERKINLSTTLLYEF